MKNQNFIVVIVQHLPIVRRITSYIMKENAPAIPLIVARCHINIGTMLRIIRDVIHARCLKKGASASTLSIYY